LEVEELVEAEEEASYFGWSINFFSYVFGFTVSFLSSFDSF
jgi:hypothetical protein